MRDITTSLFESLPYGSIDNWEELVEAFMERFFPPTLTTKRRREIIDFKQGEEESLYNAWEKYKKLLKRFPMHAIDHITQIEIFDHAMNYSSKEFIDAACCGAFKRKSVEEANQVIEDLAKSNYRAPFETSRSNSRIRRGVIKLNRISIIEAKQDALMIKMNNQERRSHSSQCSGNSGRRGAEVHS